MAKNYATREQSENENERKEAAELNADLEGFDTTPISLIDFTNTKAVEEAIKRFFYLMEKENKGVGDTYRARTFYKTLDEQTQMALARLEPKLVGRMRRTACM